MFTNGFDNLKKAFISCDKNEAEQKQFFEDFKNRLTDEGVVEDHKKFEEIVNSTLKSSRKKFSVNKAKHAQPEYSDLKFTHRNVMNFKSKKRRIPEEEKSTKDDHVEHIQESICTDQSISCYQFNESHNRVFEHSMNLDLVNDLGQRVGEVTEDDFCTNPGETIKLPGKHLKFEYLHIPHSCKIVGRPGTVLEITGAIFIGSFKNPMSWWETINSEIEDQTAVHFCEIRIIFNPEKPYFGKKKEKTDTYTIQEVSEGDYKKSTTRSQYTAQNYSEFDSLFIIDSMNPTFFEIRDCNINAVLDIRCDLNCEIDIKQKYLCSTIDQICSEETINFIKQKTDQPDLEFNSEEDIYDTLNISKLMTISCKRPPSIRIHSCMIRQNGIDPELPYAIPFYSLFKVLQNSRIQLESCCIEETLGPCIRLHNPQIFDLFDTIIARAYESGISIEISKVAIPENYCRSINIERSKISKNKGNGIEIYANEFIDQNLKITCKDSKFSKNYQYGLFIARMAIEDIQISYAKFLNNGNTGCYFKIVHQKFNKSCFSLHNCDFADNRANGLQIDDSGVNLDTINTICNSKNGIALNGTFKPTEISGDALNFLSKHGMNTTMTEVFTSSNKCHGIKSRATGKEQFILKTQVVPLTNKMVYSSTLQIRNVRLNQTERYRGISLDFPSQSVRMNQQPFPQEITWMSCPCMAKMTIWKKLPTQHKRLVDCLL
ncbi:unnamed protein product [Moneuplotes crassus]|uniref:Right handed beta helix domain-containing protein n=1 Tax=Euplotes crassus TaxID=5936 RepID=A0AAD1XVQ3_EUPCR|nr:unnamed protein product [Moneuplotes crassus]